MPASTSPRCRARALRKEVDTSARTVNVAIKKIPDAIITSMRVKAPVKGQRASRRKNEKLLVVFIFVSHRATRGTQAPPELQHGRGRAVDGRKSVVRTARSRGGWSNVHA